MRQCPLAVLVTLGLAGCGMTVRGPRQVLDPVQVAIIDHGIHSSLVLPRLSGAGARWSGMDVTTERAAGEAEADARDASHSADEFAYGEWDWFALNQEQWWRVPEVLLWPTPAALGCRPVADPGAPLADSPAPAGEGVFWLRVERWRVERLHARLSSAIAASAEHAVENRQRGLRFVPDPRPYHLLHQCNHVLAEWLVELGCGVEGDGLWAEFRVE